MIPGIKAGLDENYCVLGVGGSLPSVSKRIILGDVFMYNFYTVYDIDAMQIGIGKSIIGEGSI